MFKPGSSSVHEFPPVGLLSAGGSTLVLLGLDFGDTTHSINFTLTSSFGTVNSSVTPPVGELVRAVHMTAAGWDARRRELRGLTESTEKVDNQDDDQTVCRRVFEAANLAAITSTGNLLRFAGRSMSSGLLVLVGVSRGGPQCLGASRGGPQCLGASRGGPQCVVSAACTNMSLAHMLAPHVAAALHTNNAK